jgi:hypothetical protein
MSNLAFRLMIAAFWLVDTFFPYIDRRVRGTALAASGRFVIAEETRDHLTCGKRKV